MTRLKDKLHEVPVLNTSSLPDLIFTVLFFFMIVTHMRNVTLKVKYTLPQGTELTRLTKKQAVTYIYIGRPGAGTGSAAAGTQAGAQGSAIQVNDKFVQAQDVADYVAEEKKRMAPDDQMRMTVSVKADRNTRMAVINDVKRAIRVGGATRINYSADNAGRDVGGNVYGSGK